MCRKAMRRWSQRWCSQSYQMSLDVLDTKQWRAVSLNFLQSPWNPFTRIPLSSSLWHRCHSSGVQWEQITLHVRHPHLLPAGELGQSSGRCCNGLTNHTPRKGTTVSHPGLEVFPALSLSPLWSLPGRLQNWLVSSSLGQLWAAGHKLWRDCRLCGSLWNRAHHSGLLVSVSHTGYWFWFLFRNSN